VVVAAGEFYVRLGDLPVNPLRYLVVGLAASTISASLPAAEKNGSPDNATLIVGRWEVVKAEEDDVPVGALIEFIEGGKMKVTAKDKDGKERSHEGTYRLEGEKLFITLKVGITDEKKDPVTIKKLSATELVMIVQRNDVLELKKVM
jgi:uncharacterized protein (TIGR03066 family)